MRQGGVHAAGVIMCSEPLLDLIPILKRDRPTARSSRSSTTRAAKISACSRWTSSACAT